MLSWLIHWNPETSAAPEPHFSDTALYAETVFGFVLLEGFLFHNSVSDLDYIAGIYTKKGIALVGDLRGNFTIAIWDKHEARLHVIRDSMGKVPCYYASNGDDIWIAPMLDDLIAQSDIPHAYNAVGIAEYMLRLATHAQRHETFYKGIKRVLPAHILSVNERGQLSMERYWDPIPPGFEWASEEEVRTIPELLERAVERCLSVGTDGLALSGGYDSVTLGIMTTKMRKARGENPLHAISLRFVDSKCDEGLVQIAVAQELGLPHMIIGVEDSLAGANIVEVAIDMSRSSPGPAINIWQSTFAGMLNAASESGLSTLMMGTGGDELFTVDFAHAADLLASGRLLQFWYFYQMANRSSRTDSWFIAQTMLWNYGFSQIIGNTMYRTPFLPDPEHMRSLPVWANQANNSLYDTIKERVQDSYRSVSLVKNEGQYIRAIRNFLLSPFLMLEFDQSAVWFRERGFRLTLPFYDRDLVDLMMRIRPERLYETGWSKSYLRSFVQRHLKASLPAEKVDFTRMVHQYLRRDSKMMRGDYRKPEYLLELGIVDEKGWYEHLGGYLNNRNDDWLSFWMGLSTEAWLQLRDK